MTRRKLTPEEVADQQATDLPDREAMSIIAIGDNVAVPVNEATAVNYQSDYSLAVADADQIVIVDQSVDGGVTSAVAENVNKGGKHG
jgi:hypothetical protein